MKKDVVAGLGEIGTPILKLLSKNYDIVGYDINPKLMNQKKFNKFSDVKTSFLHIAIPVSPKFENNIIQLNKKFNPECIVIHSTISPGTTVKLQEKTYDDRDMNIRAGIHIGDIVFKGGDVFGDGVNVASRLESMAPVGGVCVSKNVYDELINQDGFEGIELGLQSLKGVGRLVEVYGLKGSKLKEPDPSDYKENKVAIHKDDEVPSIAVISVVSTAVIS